MDIKVDTLLIRTEYFNNDGDSCQESARNTIYPTLKIGDIAKVDRITDRKIYIWYKGDNQNEMKHSNIYIYKHELKYFKLANKWKKVSRL